MAAAPKLAILMFLVLGACLPLAAQQKVSLVCAQEAAGYIPAAKALWAELGFAASFVIEPAERALRDADAGMYDGDIGRAEGLLAPYPNLVYNKEPILTINLMALAKKGSTIRLASAADLKKLRVATVIGMKMAESFITTEGLEASEVPDVDSLARMLDIQRVDIALVTDTAFSGMLAELATVVAPKLASVRLLVVLNKRNAALIPQIDEAIRTMRNDGRLGKLLGQGR